MSALGRQLITSIFAIAIAATAAGTYAQPATQPSVLGAATSYVRDYLDRLRTDGVNAFYAECSLKSHGKAALFVPFGAGEGLYVELTADGMVANTATVKWDDRRWYVDVDQGGTYTIKRADAMARELLLSPFLLIQPEQFGRFWVPSKTTRSCAVR